MPSKTADIEAEVVSALSRGMASLADIEAAFDWLDDRRWLMVAVLRLLREGRIVPVGCESDHNHDGDCVFALPTS